MIIELSLEEEGGAHKRMMTNDQIRIWFVKGVSGGEGRIGGGSVANCP